MHERHNTPAKANEVAVWFVGERDSIDYVWCESISPKEAMQSRAIVKVKGADSKEWLINMAHVTSVQIISYKSDWV